MIPNNSYTPMIQAIVEEFARHGLNDIGAFISRLLNELMKAEREHVLGASPYERTSDRKGHANGFKDKSIQSRLGKLELKIPQTRGVAFYPSCIEKGMRSECALKLAIAEMYVQGVSTRRVEAITKELCDFELSSTTVSNIASLLDEELKKFRSRPLGEMAYVFLDAHYEKVRHDGQVRDIAVLKAIGINTNGRKEILGVSCSLSEAEVHWRGFIEDMLKRGLSGIKLVISDNHSGLKNALRAVLPSVPWQRCVFHLAQNAQHYAPSHALRGEIAQSVRDIYLAIDRTEAQQRTRAAITKYEASAPKFVRWLEENIEEGLTFYSFPREHWKKIRTVNVVEGLNQKIRARTRVARLFPTEASCLRLITAVCAEMHEEWVTNRKYLKN